MKVKRILIVLIGCILLTVSCTAPETGIMGSQIEGGGLSEEGQSEGGAGSQEENGDSSGNGNQEEGGLVPEAREKSVYIVGVEYPTGYDWTSSVEPVGTEALIFLMSGGTRILDFLAGEQHEVYADPRRHRCVDGHIYSDFNRGGKTIVKKDGCTLFTFDAEETVLSWAVVGDDVFTLSERIYHGIMRAAESTSGLSLRKNGELLYGNASGGVLSDLYEDGGTVGFCFRDRVRSGGHSSMSCVIYVYSDGNLSKYVCPEKIDRVLVAEKINGKLAFVGYSKSSDEYILSYDGRETVLDRFEYDYIDRLKFLKGSEKLFVYGELSDENDNLCSPAVWTAAGVFLTFSAYDKCFSVCTDADTVYTFVGKQQYPLRISAYRNGTEIFDCGTWLSVHSERASAFYDGKLYFIYGKSRPYLCPCLSKDGVETEYGFNGFFSEISVW